MTGQVKKSLFDMLGRRLCGATVADLYCGTGTLGLEALSRGAATCCFAERDREALRRLRRNVAAVAAEGRCIIWAGDVMTRLGGWLEDLARQVDVAFVDPPYEASRRWVWEQAAAKVFSPLAAHLGGDGVVVLRLPAGLEPPRVLGPLAVQRRRQYGDMVVLLLGSGAEDA
jgi:16S rRNA (guanine966-N2)-methyltransferase